MHGSSGSVSGYLSRDTIGLGNLNVREQLFAEVETNGELGFFAADVRVNTLFSKSKNKFLITNKKGYCWSGISVEFDGSGRAHYFKHVQTRFD
jgi:hypothetical protein